LEVEEGDIVNTLSPVPDFGKPFLQWVFWKAGAAQQSRARGWLSPKKWFVPLIYVRVEPKQVTT
jgi:hypothetical protein